MAFQGFNKYGNTVRVDNTNISDPVSKLDYIFICTSLKKVKKNFF